MCDVFLLVVFNFNSKHVFFITPSIYRSTFCPTKWQPPILAELSRLTLLLVDLRTSNFFDRLGLLGLSDTPNEIESGLVLLVRTAI